jgi:hypothetical protein
MRAGEPTGLLKKADGTVHVLVDPQEPRWSEDGRFVTIDHKYGTVRMIHTDYAGMDTVTGKARPAAVEILDEGF